MTRIATCAYVGTTDPHENVRRHLSAIDSAADDGAGLIVFPECSLHGYPDRRARSESSGLRRVWEQAEEAETGRYSSLVTEHAVRRGVHVVFGLNEKGEYPGFVYNTAVLSGPDGFIGCYRKVHLGASERAVWRPGDVWPVFATTIGRIGMLICVDNAWPESARELTLGGADILVMPSAWAFVVGGSASIDARWAEYYLLFDRARAAENLRWFISSNYAGALGDTVYGGYSQIVDPLGNVRATSGADGGLVNAEVDIAGEILDAEAGWFGPRPCGDRRPDTYTRQRLA